MRVTPSAVLIGVSFYLFMIYWEYTAPTAVFILMLYALFSANKVVKPKVLAPYREPDAEAMAQHHALEEDRSRAEASERRSYATSQLLVGALIGLAGATGFFLGYWNSYTPENTVRPSNDNSAPQGPPPPRREGPCQCEEVVLVVPVYEISSLGSPCEPWPHLVLRGLLVKDLVQSVCH